MILTPKTIDKWPPRDHFVMLDLENGFQVQDYEFPKIGLNLS